LTKLEPGFLDDYKILFMCPRIRGQVIIQYVEHAKDCLTWSSLKYHKTSV